MVVPPIANEPYQVTMPLRVLPGIPDALVPGIIRLPILAAFLGPILLGVIMFIRLHFFHAHLLQTLHYEVVEFIMVVVIK